MKIGRGRKDTEKHWLLDRVRSLWGHGNENEGKVTP